MRRRASQQEVSYLEFLDRLLEAELKRPLQSAISP